ncbi:hypothetical protein [Myxosarcina sp. GI1]|uniref:hypothetical protein n=1 Tax=Myxosarcina sp. GI1 TaxID=1541065 RepID=UPI000568E34F|nr:hypothetical protein [Myxosarcina sp. GI1]
MASEREVKQYLAYWFQLGKKLLWRNGQKEFLPGSIIKGDRYSTEFENCWQEVLQAGGKNYALAGTDNTIEELLSSSWEINSCAICDMPVPITSMGIQPLSCICSDLDNWPNNELPQPRSPVDSKQQLNKIKLRLSAKRSQGI